MGVQSPDIMDRLTGCLLGQALGDALGYPVEGFQSVECIDYLHSQVKPLWYSSTFEQRHPFGQYTDDTQMARELLASLNEFPDYNAEDYISRLWPLFEKRLAIGPGIACSMAMDSIRRGVPWQSAGCPPPQAGNGTAMRAAPVGMIHRGNPTEMIRVARTQGWVTHRDPRCDAGSVAIAGAVALALDGQSEPNRFCDQLADWMNDSHEEFSSYVRALPNTLALRPEEAVDRIASAGKSEIYVNRWPGISPFVIPTVLWSLYSFLRTPDDYFASVWTSIAVGGDVDTTGAITGAISGAFNGRTALPQHLLDQLHDHNEWRAADLEQLCRRAGQIST